MEITQLEHQKEKQTNKNFWSIHIQEGEKMRKKSDLFDWKYGLEFSKTRIREQIYMSKKYRGSQIRWTQTETYHKISIKKAKVKEKY